MKLDQIEAAIARVVQEQERPKIPPYTPDPGLRMRSGPWVRINVLDAIRELVGRMVALHFHYKRTRETEKADVVGKIVTALYDLQDKEEAGE